MEKKFVGIGEVVEVTLVDEHGVERQAKITPVETDYPLCNGCTFDCEDTCYDFYCASVHRADNREVIFVEVKDAADA
jgi:hypothetical protein